VTVKDDIPPAPPTNRASPLAIQAELEPLLERLTAMFSARFDSLDVRLASIGDALERNARDNRLLFDKLGDVARELANHAQRLIALERIPRLPVRVAPIKKKRRRS